jgi:hypothetical protein
VYDHQEYTVATTSCRLSAATMAYHSMYSCALLMYCNIPAEAHKSELSLLVRVCVQICDEGGQPAANVFSNDQSSRARLDMPSTKTVQHYRPMTGRNASCRAWEDAPAVDTNPKLTQRPQSIRIITKPHWHSVHGYSTPTSSMDSPSSEGPFVGKIVQLHSGTHVTGTGTTWAGRAAQPNWALGHARGLASSRSCHTAGLSSACLGTWPALTSQRGDGTTWPGLAEAVPAQLHHHGTQWRLRTSMP